MSRTRSGENHLLDAVIDKLSLKNDAALSRTLQVAPPVISKIRNKRLPVGPSMIIRLHEVSDMPIREIKSFLQQQATSTAQ